MSKPKKFVLTKNILIKDMIEEHVYAFNIAPMIYDTILAVKSKEFLYVIWANIDKNNLEIVEEYVNIISNGETIYIVYDSEDDIIMESGIPNIVDFNNMTFDTYYNTFSDDQPEGDPMVYINKDCWCGSLVKINQLTDLINILYKYANELDIKLII